jgi:hypothetical protein
MVIIFVCAITFFLRGNKFINLIIQSLILIKEWFSSSGIRINDTLYQMFGHIVVFFERFDSELEYLIKGI